MSFAKDLADLGIDLVSTGTAKALRDAGLSVRDISDLTGFPEMMDGRVKTLHPKVHGGILHIRGNAEHEAAVKAHGIEPIDLVCVNLYPFRETVAKPGVTEEDAIENIDIGGPSMVRSAAKNFRDVVILVDPADYPRVIQSLRATGGVPRPLRAELMVKAFQHTAAYDAAICNWMSRNLEQEQPPEKFPSSLVLSYERLQSLRYGENPHQTGAFYAAPGFLASRWHIRGSLARIFTTISWTSTLLSPPCQFDGTRLCHRQAHNPCGLAVRPALADASAAARRRPISAFRWHHRVQPSGGRRDGGGHHRPRHVLRSGHRARLRSGSASDSEGRRSGVRTCAC